MRSVYAKILLWSFATLALSLVAFVGVTAVVSIQTANRTRLFGQLQRLELEEAREAYEEGGQAKLARFLDRMQRRLSGKYYLTDARGRDLLTGVDRSALLATAQPEGAPPRRLREPAILAAASEDGLYRWIVEIGPPPVDLKSFLPYYALIFGAVALVCWLLAVNIASPLRALARSVDRFGAGDLGTRVSPVRKDEIGDLGRAFDRMAERIGNLVTAERRLLQDVSHELRTPLARLSFAAELMRTATDPKAGIDRLKREIQRLNDLVGALLEVTMSEGDPPSTMPEPVSLEDLLAEVVDDCRLEADGRGCAVELHADAQVIVLGDRELLRRAIENIVRNSIRYTPEGSTVEANLAATEDTACIWVRDYGPGVPDDALAKIFQPFFRVDDSRDNSTGGVGLGLAIALRAVNLHQGRLRAENAHPGLCVTIELPMRMPRRRIAGQA